MDSKLGYIKDYYLINNDDELLKKYKDIELKLIEDCTEIVLEELNLKKLTKLICTYQNREIKPKNIPQYSNLEDGTLNLVKILKYTGDKGLKYEDIGKYLLDNDNKIRKKQAYYKYGENHSKLACELGLAKKIKVEKVTKIYLTKIGYNFLEYNIEDQLILVNRMCLRIPIIQLCLVNKISSRSELLKILNKYLSPSTANRRAPNVNRLLINILEGF